MKRRLRSVAGRIASRVSSARWSSLEPWQRRAMRTVVAVFALILVTSIGYHYAMGAFEGRSDGYWHSLQVVVETYTGTGYGSDSPWTSPVANLLISVMDLSTFLLLFIVVPYVFRPVVEEALTPTAPTAVEKADHVVICGLAQQGERLVDELEARDVDYVVVAEDESEALALIEDGVDAIYGDPTSTETLRGARVGEARSVVVDTDGDRAASAVLAIRELDEAVRAVVLVRDLERERHLRYAGADAVVTPRHLLGRRIAERITTEISPARSDSVALGEGLSVLELSVFRESPIAGEPIGEIERTAGVTAIGMWQAGTFVGSPDEESIVDEETVLLVAGTEEDLRELEAETYQGRETAPNVVVAGYGHVGSTVERELEGAAADCTVIDVEDVDGVDVVGDATQDGTLLEAGIEDATVFVVAVGDDDQAVLAVLAADELADGLDTIVRVNDPANATKARRAGADYVLALPEISGRVLAREVLREEILSYNRQLKIVRIDAAQLRAGTIDETEIGETDCVVVAIERDGDLRTDVAGDAELREGDHLLVIGSDEEISAIEGRPPR